LLRLFKEFVMVSFDEDFSVIIEDRKVRLSIRVSEGVSIIKITSIPEFEAMIAEFKTKLQEADAI